MGRRVKLTVADIGVTALVTLLLTYALLPFFLQARPKTCETLCAANLQRLGQAVHLYYDDYGERLPGYLVPINDPGDLTQVREAMDYPRQAFARYGADRSTWQCPSDPSTARMAGANYIYAGFGWEVWEPPDAGDPSVVPVAWDYNACHGGDSRNILYFDNHAGPDQSKLILVSPMSPWASPTGIMCRRGQRLRIVAGGQWTTDSNSIPRSLCSPAGSSPEGPAPDPNGWGTACLDWTLPNVSLLGKIGQSRFFVGYGGEFDVASDGELLLGMNDSIFPDNAGTVWAFVSPPTEPSSPSPDPSASLTVSAGLIHVERPISPVAAVLVSSRRKRSVKDYWFSA